MSDLKISQLAAISALDDDDIMLIIEDGTAKQVTVAQLRTALAGATFKHGVLPYIDVVGWNNGNALQASGDVQYNAFYVDRTTVVTHVLVNHQTQAGNIDVGIYSDSSGPATKLASSGSIACADFVALSSPVSLDPGKYYVAETGNNGGRRVYYHTTLFPVNSTTKIWYSEAGQFPLPATAASSVNTHTVMYGIFAGSF